MKQINYNYDESMMSMKNDSIESFIKMQIIIQLIYVCNQYKKTNKLINISFVIYLFVCMFLFLVDENDNLLGLWEIGVKKKFLCEKKKKTNKNYENKQFLMQVNQQGKKE
ncbi:transmembrane protein, putative (macronuclear) [Tetrahymena thermophila SB210]|uniref:Transmembrane protein, putative n=1 Tax=Tetrahymena thermophila (strain SB210) TaxID=312017 RepID=Q230Y7_TETTS|nr:transmembrane protein, putative [Tetrahymena thermophila SB210]EAR91152.2 transmembrane protein, putative [Tetrahymena thermophila SB210]|eukprot:XP_001011397.2 transmembrane protein, putative [Tetrahymena thermophila SB210]